MSAQKIALEMRFVRLPAIWRSHKGVAWDESGKNHWEERAEYFYAPEVNSNGNLEPIEDPWRLRDQFLRMEHSEEAALSFLRQVGVWNAVEHAEPQSNLPKTRISGEFGFRTFSGLATPLTLEELWAEQEKWRALLKDPVKLRQEFGPPPSTNAKVSEHLMFAWKTQHGNTLPIHLEWKARQNPHAVLQPITGREMLIATTWIDLVSGSPIQECNHCGTPFSSPRKRMYCPPRPGDTVSACAHVVAQREYKKRQDHKKRKVRKSQLRGVQSA